MLKFIKRLAAKPAEAPEASALPVPLDLAAAKRVLVVAPHPDDETIGCGGTIAKLSPHIPVQVLLVTNGDGAGGLPEGASEKRKAEMAEALKVLGVTQPVICFDEPDGRFEDSPAFQRKFQDFIAQFKPNWVFMPWLQDYHADHWKIARAAGAVLAKSEVEQVLYYEIWTPVPASHVVDISDTAELKRAALMCHRTALDCGNYMEATFGLNAYRAIYVPSREARYAEVFAVRTAQDCSRA